MVFGLARTLASQQTFDPVAEKKLRRKIDLFVVPGVSLLYLLSFVDRTNIGTYLLHHHQHKRQTVAVPVD